MLNRLASQTNLMSTSPSSEISDQCLLESSFFPEIGSLFQSGGNPVFTNLCSKYLSSPFKTRSASFTACCGFQGTPSGNLASLKKNAGEFCLRHCVYSSGFDGTCF